MKKILALLACTACFCNLQAQGTVNIADTAGLTANAHCVKLYESNAYIVSSVDKAVYNKKEIITVLDKKGENQLFFYEYTDKFTKLESAEIVIYNSLGFPTKTYTKKDFNQNATGEGLIDDGRYFYLGIKPDSYPFTLSYTSSISKKGMVNYPSFIIQEPSQGVKHAEYTVSLPNDIGLRYFNQATAIKPTIKDDGKNISYTWQVDDLKAAKAEDGTKGWQYIYPRVWVAANKFKLDNYAGDFSSWQSFGKWYGDLGASARDLSANDKAMLQKMVQDATDPKEKANIIYNYLQDNFRYVSIQLGIGGFRPFAASNTQNTKYGDCKALSNYMQACLDAVNIKSYQALINAGANAVPANPDFPVDVFNHVIVCVPFENDSLWLECTSKHNDFGVLGDFTENRNALLITENGGVLVPTPRSKAADNKQGIKATVKLTEAGSGEVHTTVQNSGEYKMAVIGELYNEAKSDQQAAIISRYSMPAPEHFELTLPANNKTKILEAGFDAGFDKIPSFSSGNKMFLPMQWHPLPVYSLPSDTARQQDYYFAIPYEKEDTTIYQLPAGFIADNLPGKTELSSKYASYKGEVSYDKNSNTVTSTARVVLQNHQIPAADFAETRKFFSDVIKAQTQKIVVLKE